MAKYLLEALSLGRLARLASAARISSSLPLRAASAVLAMASSLVWAEAPFPLFKKACSSLNCWAARWARISAAEISRTVCTCPLTTSAFCTSKMRSMSASKVSPPWACTAPPAAGATAAAVTEEGLKGCAAEAVAVESVTCWAAAAAAISAAWRAWFFSASFCAALPWS